MESVTIVSAQYLYSPFHEKDIAVRVDFGHEQRTIPLDPANRHYAEIMRQVEEGTLVIQEADTI